MSAEEWTQEEWAAWEAQQQEIEFGEEKKYKEMESVQGGRGSSRRGTHEMIEQMQQDIVELKTSIQQRDSEMKPEKKKKKKEKLSDAWGDEAMETFADADGQWKDDSISASSEMISSVSSDEDAQAERDAAWEAGKHARKNIREHMMEVNDHMRDEDRSSDSAVSANSDVDMLFAKLTGVKPPKSKKKKKKKRKDKKKERKKRPEEDTEDEKVEKIEETVLLEEEEAVAQAQDKPVAISDEPARDEPDEWMRQVQEEQEEEEMSDADSWLAGEDDEDEEQTFTKDKHRKRPADPGLDDAMQRSATRGDSGATFPIKVTIVRARGVITGARKDDVAVYCACQIKKTEHFFTTPTVLSTDTPEWHHTHKFQNYSEEGTLVFRLWDATRYGDDFLGRGKLRPADLIDGFDGEITLTGTEDENIRAALQVRVELLELGEDEDEEDESLQTAQPQAPWEMAEDKLREVGYEDDYDHTRELDGKSMPRTASGFLTGGVPKIRIQIMSAIIMPEAVQVSNSALYCTCTNLNKKHVWFQTHVCYETEQPVWNYEQNLADYDAEDVFQFKLIEKDSSGEIMIGKAKLHPEHILPHGFDGELEMSRGHPVLLRVKFEHLLPLQADEEEAQDEVVPESGLWHASEHAADWERELQDEQEELQGRQAQDTELDQWHGFAHLAAGEVPADVAPTCKLTIIGASIELQGDEIACQFLSVAGDVKDKPQTEFQSDIVSDTLCPIWEHEVILANVDEGDSLRFYLMEGDEVVAKKKVKLAKLTSPDFEGYVELTTLIEGVQASLSVSSEWVAHNDVQMNPGTSPRATEVPTTTGCKIMISSASIELQAEEIACQHLLVAGDVKNKPGNDFMTNVSETLHPIWDQEILLPDADQGDTLRLSLKEGDDVVAKNKVKLAALTSPDFDGHIELTSLVEGVHVILSVGIKWLQPSEAQAYIEAEQAQVADVTPSMHGIGVTVLSAAGLKQVPDVSTEPVYTVGFEKKKKIMKRNPDAFVQCMAQGRSQTLISVSDVVRNARDPVWKNAHVEIPQFHASETLVFTVLDGGPGAEPDDERYNLGIAELVGQHIPPNGFKGSLALGEEAFLEVEVEWLSREQEDVHAIDMGEHIDAHVTVVGAMISDSQNKISQLELHVVVYNDDHHILIETNDVDSTLNPMWHHEHRIPGAALTDNLEVVLCNTKEEIGEGHLPVHAPADFDGHLQLQCFKSGVEATVMIYVDLVTGHGMDKSCGKIAPHIARDAADPHDSSVKIIGQTTGSLRQSTPGIPDWFVWAPVRLTIVSARNLFDADEGFLSKKKDRSDPYCMCEIRGKKQTRFQTAVKKDTTDPVWNHSVQLEEFSRNDALDFKVYDEDWGRDAILGEGFLTAIQVLPHGFDGDISLKRKEKDEGATLQVKVEILQDMQPTHAVKIICAEGLRNADSWLSGKSDPYCTVEIIGKSAMFQTRVIEDSLNPAWNHKILTGDYAPGDTLRFCVWDKDEKDDEPLGVAHLASEELVPNGFDGQLLLEAATNGSSSEDPCGKLKVQVQDFTEGAEKKKKVAFRRMKVTIASATNIRNAKYGVQDQTAHPYCTCELNGRREESFFQTPGHENALNPVWNYSHIVQQCLYTDRLVFKLQDTDESISRETALGTAELELAPYFDNGFKGDLQVAGSGMRFPPLLSVELAVLSMPLAQVNIIGAIGLRREGKTSIRVPDGFCVCTIKGKPQPEFRTRVIDNSNSPSWGHVAFVSTWLAQDEFVFTVWDKDVAGDTFLGSASLQPVFYPNGFEGHLELIGSDEAFPPSLEISLVFIVQDESSVADKPTERLHELSEDKPTERLHELSDNKHAEPEDFKNVSVKIVGVEGLLDETAAQVSEPFVKCEIKGKPSQKFQTQSINGMADPLWNHENELTDYHLDDTFIFTIWDQDAPEQKLLGHAMLRPKDLYPDGHFSGKLKLSSSTQKKAATLRVAVDVRSKDEITELHEEAMEETKVVHEVVPDDIKGISVYIRSGHHLGYSDPAILAHKSDPYCSCELKFKPGTYHKTPTAKGTLDPVWNYSCRIDQYELEDTLLFSVWDQFVQGQDFLGKAVLTKSFLWPDGFAGDITLHDDMHRESGVLKVMVKILRGNKKPSEIHETLLASMTQQKTDIAQTTSTRLAASGEQTRDIDATSGLASATPSKQYPSPDRTETRVDPRTQKAYTWLQFREAFQDKMPMEDIMSRWFEQMQEQESTGLSSLKVVFGSRDSQMLSQVFSVHPIADDSYICKPKLNVDTTVLYVGPNDKDLVVKVFKGIPEGLVGSSCKRYEYVGFIHAMQEGPRQVTVEANSVRYFLCLEIRCFLNQQILAGYSLREQRAWLNDVCYEKDHGLFEKQADRADFLVCFADSECETNGVLLQRLMEHGPKSGPWGNFRDPLKFCSDFSIGIGRHAGEQVDLRLGPCQFGRSLAGDVLNLPSLSGDADVWFQEYGRAAKQTTYGVLVLMPSAEYVTSDTSKIVLRYIPEDRKFVYDHGTDCVIILAEYFHRIMGSGPAIIRAASSGDVAAVQVFLTTDPSASSALVAADGAGNTPLHQAALFGHYDLCKVLLDAGASPNIADHLGFTPLYQAAVHGQAEIVDLLLAAEGNVDLPNVMGQPMLEVASQRGYRPVVLRLRNAGAPEYYKEEPSMLNWTDRVNDRLRSAPTRW